MFIGLGAQWCKSGKKRAERKRSQNNFSKFHFFSREVERVPRHVSSKLCTRLPRRSRYRKLVASAELARTGSMGQPGCEHVHILSRQRQMQAEPPVTLTDEHVKRLNGFVIFLANGIALLLDCYCPALESPHGYLRIQLDENEVARACLQPTTGEKNHDQTICCCRFGGKPGRLCRGPRPLRLCTCTLWLLRGPGRRCWYWRRRWLRTRLAREIVGNAHRGFACAPPSLPHVPAYDLE